MTSNVYPQATYEIWLDSPTGLRLALVENVTRFSSTRRRNTIGRFTVALPADTIDDSAVQEDAMLEIWRSRPGVPARLWMLGLVRDITFAEVGGADQLILSGEDGIGLLACRIVAYAADTAQAAKTGYADNLMKAVVRENLGASAVAARNLTAYNITVEADLSLGPSITKKFAWKGVLDTLLNIADTAATAGTPVFFDMIPRVISPTSLGWLFQTFVNRLGADRTYESGWPTVFGREWGNLENPRLTYDYTREISYVYAGGQGEGSDREVVSDGDDARIGQSPWNRRERFVEASNETSTAALTARVQQALEEGQPRVLFSGTIKDSLQTKYGIDWNFGDVVVAIYRDRSFNGHVDAVTIAMDENGLENISARVEVVL